MPTTFKTQKSNEKIPQPPPHAQPYAPPPRATRKRPAIDNHALALSVTITLAILVLIGVPIGAILPERYVVKLPINILVPLYLEPESGIKWDRLFEGIIKHRELNFTVIVDPSNGPSTPPHPGSLYVEAIKRLNVFPNVHTIGYVNIEHAHRDNATVHREIATYAGWATETGLALHGIFFDQTPSEDIGDAKQYLKSASATVCHSDGFLEPKLVVHNPGRVPNSSLESYHADVTVVFEGAFEDVPTRDKIRAQLNDRSGGRSDYAYLVHSMPQENGKIGLRRLINGVRRDIQWLYVTDRKENVYGDYSAHWEDFLSLTW
ncbi:Spherulation-specific family 4-domain-containing protein [Massariosphaeria phaeospora]|uniref:Spherulation-specific family 4-domain-containing protein n=1 Tax=Massariosphaeria phaeospora TaxID=100035 RepID=A0A7C8I6J9_9PLEO|nr:Spherulation-specific family 4-domain-containing protein [Massariosphaeria phaeospora]